MIFSALVSVATNRSHRNHSPLQSSKFSGTLVYHTVHCYWLREVPPMHAPRASTPGYSFPWWHGPPCNSSSYPPLPLMQSSCSWIRFLYAGSKAAKVSCFAATSLHTAVLLLPTSHLSQPFTVGLIGGGGSLFSADVGSAAPRHVHVLA